MLNAKSPAYSNKRLKEPNSQTVSCSEEDEDSRAKSGKLHKYNDKYIGLGLIEKTDSRPKCAICLKVLANEAVKPA